MMARPGTVDEMPERLDHLANNIGWWAARREEQLPFAARESVRPPGQPISYGFVTAEWARRWPAEEAWRVRRS